MKTIYSLLLGMPRLRFFSVICVMVLSSLGIFMPVYALDNAYWSDLSVRETPSGSGTENDPYLISKGAHLGWIAAFQNDGSKDGIFDNAYFKLVADINLSAHKWAPIGTDQYRFGGRFFGDGHVISDLYCYRDLHDTGFFGSTEVWFYCSDLTLKNPNFEITSSYSGPLVGYLRGTVENCHVIGGIIKPWTRSGGLIGSCGGGTPKLIRCSSSITIESRVGYNDCSSHGCADSGGLIGMAESKTEMQQCIFTGTLKMNNNQAYGGLVGYVNNAQLVLEQCVFDGAITGLYRSYRGFVVGYINDGSNVDIIKLYVRDDVDKSADVGYVCAGGSWVGASNRYYVSTNYINTPAFAYQLNNNGHAAGKCWGYDKTNTKLIIAKDSATCKVAFGNSVSSIQSTYANYTATDAYAPKNSLVTVIGQNKFCNYLAPGSVSNLGSATRTGLLTFTGKVNSDVQTPAIVYKDMTYFSPKILSANFEVFDKSVKLKWTPQCKNTSNRAPGKIVVWRKLSGGNWTKLAVISDLNASEYIDATVSYDKQYYYKVMFVDDKQNQNQMQDACQSTDEANAGAGVQTNLSFNISLKLTPVNGGIKLEFSVPNHANINGASYAIKRSGQVDITGTINLSGSSTYFTVTPSTATDTRDMSLCYDKDYKVEVSGFQQTVGGKTNPLYGNTFSSATSYAKPQGNIAFESGYKASKGEYSNQVKLSWSVTKPAGSVEELRFDVFRRVAESNSVFDKITSIRSADKSFLYNDDKSLPGICYEYKVVLFALCDGVPSELATISDIGFSQSKGTIAGQVTYSGGTAVPNVDVFVRRNDLSGNESQFKSLYFSGGESNTKWYMGKERELELFNRNDFSIQMYVRPDATTSNPGLKGIFDIFYHLEVFLEAQTDNTYKVRLKCSSENGATSNFKIPASKYTQLNVVRRGSKVHLIAVNDQNPDSVFLETLSVTLTKDTMCNFGSMSSDFVDGTDPSNITLPKRLGYYVRFGYGFQGNLDELRYWNKGLTDSEILTNYNRILTGNEENLKAYWQFDEGLTTRLFDCSRTNGIMNENHGYIDALSARPDNIIPAETQLGLKGISDANGNYLIRGVPYSGDGSSYAIVPMLGVHEFKPNEHLRYIGGTSLVHNGTDFEDISSFSVKGKVVYAGGNYPVAGAQLNVDGLAASRDGQLITTNSNGEFEVNVPIGNHFVSVTMLGHTFAYGGRYPLTGKMNFQDNVKDLLFTDSTTVRIAGRVTGGAVEEAKTLGFGLSKANIGKATIVLTPQSTLYKLNTDGSDRHNTALIGNRNCQTSILNNVFENQIVIKTDSLTGEFLSNLPPIPYKIVNVSTDSLDNSKFSYASLEMFTPNVNNPETLTYEDSIGTQSFDVHSKLLISHYTEPQFLVSDKSNTVGAFGDSTFCYVDFNQNLKDTISLYSSSQGTVSYALGYPVFTKQNKYTWAVKAFEEYTNYDSGIPVVDIVPLKGITVFADNALASPRVDIDTVTNASTLTVGSAQFVLNDKGEANYTFFAGFPNLTGDKSLAANLYFTHNGKTIKWLDTDFKGYVFGDVPSVGSNFITEGPDLVDYVLRDPSGSNSYAYMEEGSIIQTERTLSSGSGVSSSSNATLKLGGEQSLATGLGVAVIIETSANLDASLELNTQANSTTASSVVNTTEVKQRLQTSDSPDFVGSEGDIYLGQSTNMIYGLVRNLALYPSATSSSIQGFTGANYELTNKEILSAGIQFATTFTYTQNYILNYLIPNIEANRNSLIQSVEVIPTNINRTLLQSPVYYSMLAPSDVDFGTDGTYDVFYPEKTGKVYTDKVKEYNTWIRLWQATISENERTKVAAMSSGVPTNKSFDAGAVVEESITKTIENIDSWDFTSELEVANGYEAGFEIAGIGFNLSTRLGVSGTTSDSGSSSTTNSKTVGYVLADDSQGDAYSIDVYPPTASGGYIFRTQAGQTKCPYEQQESTLFYEPGQHKLNNGTFQVEKPRIFIDNKTNAFVGNVPSGREASFIIQLGNESEINQPITYQLFVENGSNPDGLILSIDGTPLTSPRTFLVDDMVEKTLKVRQSSLDKLNYSNIKLILSSTCQVPDDSDRGGIYSAATLGVEFIPSCTDLKLTSDETLVNINSGGVITFNISEYDRGFRNFASIRLQYKNVNDHSWTTIREFINDTNLIALTTTGQELISEAAIQYAFDMNVLVDGSYSFRAISVGKLSNEEITVSSPEIQMIKDMVAPQLMGKASPSTGVLTPDGEVSVLFNEMIKSANITTNNITVKAVLNGATLQHSVGLNFTNGAPASTEATISLANRSFSLESWYKRVVNQPGVLFAHGDQFSLAFNADNKVVVTINGQIFTSVATLTNENWQYIGFSYNNDNKTFSVYALYESTNATLFNNQVVTKSYIGNGRLVVGKNFSGSVHEMTLWGKARLMSDLSDKNNVKSSNTTDLLGYWRMNEGTGSIAQDVARSRHLILPTVNNWYFNNINKSVLLNGTSNHLKINTGNIPIGIAESFVIEFWFKGAAQANKATLFSCGHGLLDAQTNDKLSIGFNQNGLLELNTLGSTYQLSNSNYLDNAWHHFALNVIRNGSATIYVDGTAVKQMAVNTIGALQSDNMVIGACYYKPVGATTLDDFVTESFFKGQIDEVRIWRATATAEFIRLNKGSRLSGSETGLVAYYPFERTYVDGSNQNVTEGTLLDQLNQPQSSGLIAAGEAAGTCTYSDDAPGLTEVRSTETVLHSFVASNNKLVVSITELPSNIENCTLEFLVRDISDLNGNYLRDPICWTAYVDMNRLQWSQNSLDVVQEQLATSQFEVFISNQSGKEENWIISHLPSWLNVSKAQGALKPLSTQKMVFTVAESTPIGSYESTIYLVGNNQYAEPFAINLKVTGERPTWTLNPDEFEKQMNVIATLQIEGVITEDKEDIVAAFVDNKCVGLVTPTYLSRYDKYFVLLDIYGNDEMIDKRVQFKVWDASTGKIYPVVESTPTISFANNSMVGSMSLPATLNARLLLEQKLPLSMGWNWISTNVEPVENTLDTLLSDVVTSVQLIKQKSLMALPDGTNWIGTLGEINVAEMYKVKMNVADTVVIIGQEVNPQEHLITLNPSWNWIGYVPQGSMSLSNSLADLEATENDIIKGQKQFAVYTGNEWVGSLITLVPGRGYLYKSMASQDASFYYPSNSVIQQQRIAKDVNPLHFTPVSDNRYSGSMSVIGIVKNANELIQECEVAAFVGEECRGSILTDEEGRVFLSIAGEDVADVHFKVFYNNEEYALEQSIPYSDEAIVGSLSTPYIFQLDNLNPVNDVLINGLTVYPTRINDVVYVESTSWPILSTTILDMSGRVALQLQGMQVDKCALQVFDLPSGVYTIVIETSIGFVNKRLIK